METLTEEEREDLYRFIGRIDVYHDDKIFTPETIQRALKTIDQLEENMTPGTLKGLERKIRELEAKNKRLKKELVVVGDVLDAKPGDIARAAKSAVKAPSVHMKFNAILTARIDVCIEILSHAGIDRSGGIVDMVMDAAELIARRNSVD